MDVKGTSEGADVGVGVDLLKRANVVSVFMTGSPFLLAFLASGIMGKLWESEIPWKPIDFMASSYRKIGIV